MQPMEWGHQSGRGPVSRTWASTCNQWSGGASQVEDGVEQAGGSGRHAANRVGVSTCHHKVGVSVRQRTGWQSKGIGMLLIEQVEA